MRAISSGDSESGQVEADLEIALLTVHAKSRIASHICRTKCYFSFPYFQEKSASPLQL
jgi:hypothetical protein